MSPNQRSDESDAVRLAILEERMTNTDRRLKSVETLIYSALIGLAAIVMTAVISLVLRTGGQ